MHTAGPCRWRRRRRRRRRQTVRIRGGIQHPPGERGGSAPVTDAVLLAMSEQLPPNMFALLARAVLGERADALQPSADGFASAHAARVNSPSFAATGADAARAANTTSNVVGAGAAAVFPRMSKPPVRDGAAAADPGPVPADTPDMAGSAPTAPRAKRSAFLWKKVDRVRTLGLRDVRALPACRSLD